MSQSAGETAMRRLLTIDLIDQLKLMGGSCFLTKVAPAIPNIFPPEPAVFMAKLDKLGQLNAS